MRFPQQIATTSAVVVNKVDLADVSVGSRGAIKVSAKTGVGLESLRQAIVSALNVDTAGRIVPMVTNLRHVDFSIACPLR
jgi:tRNA U34 5-carboxymethylaminomethyl modifying GTPase MnmE/TrmE